MGRCHEESSEARGNFERSAPLGVIQAANAYLAEQLLRTGDPCLALMMSRNYRLLSEIPSRDQTSRNKDRRISLIWLDCYKSMRSRSGIREASRCPEKATGALLTSLADPQAVSPVAGANQ